MNKIITSFFVTLFFNLSFCQTIKIESIQVSSTDLPGYYTLSQANVYLAQNKDWRLPTIEELQTIYNNRSSISGFKFGGNAYLADGKQNNFKFPNSQAEYGWANAWALEFGTGRWVQPSTSTQLLIRLVKKQSTASVQNTSKPVEKKSNSNQSSRSKSYDSPITTYSASYGLTGAEFNQPEVQFNLETTYMSNSRFTQLYRWRYAMGDFKGLTFEYNNRMYFGKDRLIEPSKWYLQGKVGYGLLKGKDYLPNTLYYLDDNNFYVYNNTTITDSRHKVLNYGLSIGYKYIWQDRISLDFHTGYVGYTQPKFVINSPFENNLRSNDWVNGIGSPFEFHWSIGFYLD